MEAQEAIGGLLNEIQQGKADLTHALQLIIALCVVNIVLSVCTMLFVKARD